MTAKQAVEDALNFATTANRKPPESVATAAVVTYLASQRSLDESDPRIAPKRCVWLVKVNAALQFHTGPPGVHLHSAPSFSVLYDVNSGFMFEVVPQYPSSASDERTSAPDPIGSLRRGRSGNLAGVWHDLMLRP
jgi:hypothetical protein